MADFIWEDEAFRCCEFTDGEDVQCFFSDKPALKLGQQFTGTAAETTLPPFFPLLFFRLNAVNAFIPTEKRRYFSGETPLTPLYQQKNAVNAAIFPVKRR